jgi:hypothetical protein
MAAHTVARSVSRSVSERVLRGPVSSARVLAVFEHACDLVTSDEDVIAVVAPSVGDGPLNIVLNREDASFAALEQGAPVRLGQQRLHVASLEIDLVGAEVWEPRPNWPALRARRRDAAINMLTLGRLCRERSPDGSLFRLLEGKPGAAPGYSTVRVVARRAVGALREGWTGDRASLQGGARLLAGLGGGLTPSGDDFLAGLMLWAWVAHRRPRWFCRAVVETAAGLTTALSRALLRAAARGECSAAWHALLAALVEGDDAALTAAATRVLSHGATSGADTLAGFLWAGAQISLGEPAG